ncbi:hypothetical protein Dxin01_00784 [Deinococcus xinjiangensis]|uniref:Uncharacterized protein n=1 Tax=Deinococcus xinjiangensis TaxID=457454 RepID=A0ABP9VCL7_9DEIO
MKAYAITNTNVSGSTTRTVKAVSEQRALKDRIELDFLVFGVMPEHLIYRATGSGLEVGIKRADQTTHWTGTSYTAERL